jgi:hypothetical protein
LPSPVRISAISPRWSTMPPISCTSKWRMAEHALGSLAHRGEGLGQDVVELLPEDFRLIAKLVVIQSLDFRLKRVDRVDIFAEAADIAVVCRSEDASGQCGEHEIPLDDQGARRNGACLARVRALRRRCRNGARHSQFRRRPWRT